MTRPIEYTINPLGFLENAAVGFFTDAAVGLTQTVFNGVKTVADACSNFVDSAVDTFDQLMEAEPEIEEYSKEQIIDLMNELKADKETMIQEGSINEIPKVLLWDYILPEDRILINDEDGGAAILPMKVYENALKYGIYPPDQDFSVILDFNGQDLIIDCAESYQSFCDRTGWDYLNVIPMEEIMSKLAEEDEKSEEPKAD